MSNHEVTVLWELSSGDFLRGTYSRAHSWRFDGGVTLPASPSPSVVRVPYSDPSAVDPEEAFVASLASCHMLTFLHLASRARIEVLRYEDEAVGTLSKNERGALWVSQVVLRPAILYGENTPSVVDERKLHELAHEDCFISNSVKTQVTVRPRAASALV